MNKISSLSRSFSNKILDSVNKIFTVEPGVDSVYTWDDLYSFLQIAKGSYLDGNKEYFNHITTKLKIKALDEEYNNAERNLEDFENCTFYRDSESGADIYLFYYKNKLIITIRGTNELKDVFIDFNNTLVPVKLFDTECGIHEGFYNQYKSIKSIIDEKFEDYVRLFHNNDPHVVFVAHSLGASVQTIAALHLKEKYPDIQIDVISFGSPRAGDSNFVNTFNDHIEEKLRIVNQSDSVVFYFSNWPKYQHVDHLIPLNHIHDDQNLFTSFVKLIGLDNIYDALIDHMVGSYQETLSYYVSKQQLKSAIPPPINDTKVVIKEPSEETNTCDRNAETITIEKNKPEIVNNNNKVIQDFTDTHVDEILRDKHKLQKLCSIRILPTTD